MKIKIVKKCRFHFKRIWNPENDTYYRNIALGFIRIFYDLLNYIPIEDFLLCYKYYSDYGHCYYCNKNKKKVVEFGGYQICKKCFKKISRKDLDLNETN